MCSLLENLFQMYIPQGSRKVRHKDKCNPSFDKPMYIQYTFHTLENCQPLVYLPIMPFKSSYIYVLNLIFCWIKLLCIAGFRTF
jgi:hypothetical protein